MDWCGGQPSIRAWQGAPVQGEGAGGLRFLLAGHSRGGKTSVLAAAADRAEGRSRVCGLVLIDPADGSYDAVVGPRCARCQGCTLSLIWGRLTSEQQLAGVGLLGYTFGAE